MGGRGGKLCLTHYAFDKCLPSLVHPLPPNSPASFALFDRCVAIFCVSSRDRPPPLSAPFSLLDGDPPTSRDDGGL